VADPLPILPASTLVPEQPLHLFEGWGIELEYMIVSRDTLDVLPVSDQVLHAVSGTYASEVPRGATSWSNELVLHVIETKTNGPAASLHGLAAEFQADVAAIDAILAPLGGRLMPTGMHPWMDPFAETKLWPHDYNAVYEAFNRIFDCRGHGWSNLQSTHINLPFADDAEFGRLHAAIRLVLPILPALAASSPLMDGGATGVLDNRLEVYRQNAHKLPSLSGKVVPERFWTRADYEGVLLAGLYRDVAPHDPDGILQEEWLNARGAIARFDRHAIEIRVLDIQECPLADLAIAALAGEAVRAGVDEVWQSTAAQQEWEVGPLAAILLACIRDVGAAVIDDARYLEAFGFPRGRATAAELWRHLRAELLPEAGEFAHALYVILEKGTLARRILLALDGDTSREKLAKVYQRLCDCLARGEMFEGLA